MLGRRCRFLSVAVLRWALMVSTAGLLFVPLARQLRSAGSSLAMMIATTFPAEATAAAGYDDALHHRQTTTTTTTMATRPTASINNYHRDNDDDADDGANDDLRLCRLPETPRLNETQVLLQPWDLDVGYQCDGAEYDQCVAAVEQLARNNQTMVFSNSNSSGTSSTWGRKGVPFLGMDHANGGAAVLFMGNSHTRQILEALLCQYNDDVVQVDSTFVRLKNNVTIYHSTNQFYHHLPSQWDTYLERHALMGGRRSLSSLDAIVLGDFNVPRRTRGSNFYREVTRRAAEEGVAVAIDELFTPTVDAVARAYTSGPIVYVSKVHHSTTTLSRRTAQRLQTVRREQPDRTNVAALAGGRYVAQIGQCTSRDNQKVGPAHNDQNGQGGHRCMGRGGHPDLLAWDVAELLQQLLLPQTGA